MCINYKKIRAFDTRFFILGYLSDALFSLILGKMAAGIASNEHFLIKSGIFLEENWYFDTRVNFSNLLGLIF